MKNREVENSVDMDLACIPSNYSRLIARELGLQVRDLTGLLEFTSVSIEQLLDEDTQLTPRQQIQILKNSLKLTCEEDFGLKLGKRFTSPTHGAMGFLVNSSPNLLMALKAIQTFLPTRMNLARLDLNEQKESLEITTTFDPGVSKDVLPILSEIFAVIFTDCAEFILGRPLSEVEIYFAHDRSFHIEKYADYLPGSITFSAQKIKAKIPMSVCEIPNVSANQETYLMALRQCEFMLAKLKTNKKSYKYQIQKMMLLGPLNMLNEDEIAAALFISKRTLARRLKQEDTSFRQLRDEILSQQAIGYLRNSKLSVDAIAAQLNYHDSSNFRRAFKRWFNVTPDQYRKQL